MALCLADMLPHKDPTLSRERLSDPAYYAQQLALYESDPKLWTWYLNPHAHTCPRCARIISHTGLDAERDEPTSHLCCGHDVRART